MTDVRIPDYLVYLFAEVMKNVGLMPRKLIVFGALTGH
jgi:hypothetical protein